MNPEELSMAVIVAHVAYDCLQHLTAKRKASFKQQCLYLRRNIVGQYGAFPSHIQAVPLVRGNTLAPFAREVRAFGNPVPPPACLIFGGETTVVLGADHRRGERNQELALRLRSPCAPCPLLCWLRWRRTAPPTAREPSSPPAPSREVLQLALQHHLDRRDAHSYLERVGDLLVTGPTYTNVNDWLMFCVWA